MIVIKILCDTNRPLQQSEPVVIRVFVVNGSEFLCSTTGLTIFGNFMIIRIGRVSLITNQEDYLVIIS